MSGVFVRQFRASRNTGAPAVGYCLVFLSCIFGPRRTLGLQLSGIVSGNFKAWGKLGTQLFVSFLSFLEKPREAQKGPERPRAAQKGSEILSGRKNLPLHSRENRVENPKDRVEHPNHRVEHPKDEVEHPKDYVHIC